MTRLILHGSVLVVALAGMLAYVGVLPFAQAGTAPHLSLRPPAGNITAGDTFEVEVHGQGMPSIGAFEAVIAYDDTKVAYVSGVETAFLGSTGRTVSCPPPAVVLPGIARFGCGSYYMPPPAPEGPSGDAVLARLTFRALAPGETDLVFAGGGLAEELGDSIPSTFGGADINIVLAAPPTSSPVPTATSTTPPTSTASPVPTSSSTAEPSPTEVIATSTNTASPTVSPPAPDDTATPSPTPTETSTSEPTATPSLTSTAEPASPTMTVTPQQATTTPVGARSPVASRTAGSTRTPAAAGTVTAIPSETPAPPRDTETPEPRATETGIPEPKATETPKPEPTPGTPVFAPPGETATAPASTSTPVPTATNTRAPSTPTSTRTLVAITTTQPGSPSPAATAPVGVAGSQNDVLGQRVAPSGIVLPSTGHGAPSGGRGTSIALSLAPIAAAFLLAALLTHRRRRS